MNKTELLIAEAVSNIAETERSQLLEMVSAYRNETRANKELKHLTGISGFFSGSKEFEEFRKQLALPVSTQARGKGREWGDFQTPLSLALRGCQYLVEHGVSPRTIIEPTYGTGHFILAALKSFPAAELVYGIEIQERYEWHFKSSLLMKALNGYRASVDIELHRDDVFSHRFPDRLLNSEDILIIGNPPWVTSAELGALDSRNLPVKRNLKALGGMDAMTGKSNFDIGEFILLRLLELFSTRRGWLAMLCKNSVIKNLIHILQKRPFSISDIQALEIDAGKEFNASVEASLLLLNMGTTNPSFTCRVASLMHPDRTKRHFGWARKKFVSNIEDYESSREFDGISPLEWRQGIKHDCARIMELNSVEGRLINGLGEAVDIESEMTYWLLKSSDLRAFEVNNAKKKVIVTQHQLGEETSKLETLAPALWRYLTRNSRHMEARKSSIYRGKPPFSIFGIGSYSFMPYKVAISGLYKEPVFSIVPPITARPVMVDDTCYFLGFDKYRDALFTASLLNSELVKRLLRAIVFADAKRPYTKEVLMRIDLARVALSISLQSIRGFWTNIGYRIKLPVTEFDYEEYKQRLMTRQEREEAQLSFG